MSAKHRVKGALLVPDEGVAVPARNQPHSFTSQLASLAVGETAAKVTRIDSSYTVSEIAESLAEWRNNMRNNLAPSVKSAKMKLGETASFTIEVIDAQTSAVQWYVIGLVTRTA